MATWIWLNTPAMAAAFALTVGIPARMVLRDARKQPALALATVDGRRHDRAAELVAA